MVLIWADLSHNTLLPLVLLGASATLLACDDVFGVACTSELIFSVSVNVRDVTDAPASWRLEA